MNGKTDQDWNLVSDDEDEDSFDVFYLYFGILRNVLRTVCPELWKELLRSSYEERDI